jgi:hypothetical protein
MMPWSRFYFGNNGIFFLTCPLCRHAARRALSAGPALYSRARRLTPITTDRELVPVGNLIRLASEAESRNVSIL